MKYGLLFSAINAASMGAIAIVPIADKGAPAPTTAAAAGRLILYLVGVLRNGLVRMCISFKYKNAATARARPTRGHQ